MVTFEDAFQSPVLQRRGNTQIVTKLAIVLVFTSKFAFGQIPIASYVGIRFSDSSYARIKQNSLASLSLAYSQYKDVEIQADIEEIQSKAGQIGSWQYSYEPHITSQFLGGTMPADPVQRSLYENFEEDIPCTETIPAVAYLPGNLIAGIGFTDLSRIYMLNSFPHTTLFNKKLAAKYSNDLIESLAKNEQFSTDYNQKFQKASPVSSYQVQIEGKTYTAYVIVIKPDRPYRASV